MHLHHVQISMPPDGEDEARRFYSSALGLTEVPKPPALAGRGGCWFRGPADAGSPVEIHLGVEEPFTPAAKAHPALLLETVTHLEELADRIEGAGYEVSWAERTTFDGFERFHCRDGFGNRVEVLAPGV
jgi:catechol 2,3-dioxygenase-like lactoylglutathione lyase family enzyme